MKTSTGDSGGRPMLLGTRGVVSAGHYLAAEAGMQMLRRGGNAMDAAAAAGFALAVVLPQQNGLLGEAPMLVYSAAENATWALSGHGTAPQAASIEHFRRLGLEIIPGDGLLPAVVPSAVGAYLLLLERFGTLRLSEVLSPAIHLARAGFAMYDALSQGIAAQAARFRRDWPSSAAAYLVKGRAPRIGWIWQQADLARTLEELAAADHRRRSRRAGVRAAWDRFYRGPIARRIARFCRSSVPDGTGRRHAGLLREEDLAGYQACLEPAVSVRYRGWRVFKCGPWTQGPVMLQTLMLLKGFDLAAMGHNSADYVHTVVECMKLAFADREFYYGDPRFVGVPLKRLLSEDYARARRALVDPAAASIELRPGGMPPLRAATGNPGSRLGTPFATRSGDTTSVQVADRAGNVVSVVPSGGWLMSSPAVPGVGAPLGTRGQMFSLVEGHPNCLAPLKRPRTTLTPTLAGLGNQPPHLAFASPGGDSQDQWTLQFFLDVVHFGLSLQQAVEAPTFWTNHFPSSFHPRSAEPASLCVESRIGQEAIDELARRGHRLSVQSAWAGGNTMAAAIDRRSGVLSAAASPRYNPAYASGW